MPLVRPPCRLLGLVAMFAVAATGCGKGKDKPRATEPAGSTAPAVDRSSPEVVLVAAHRALSAGDLEAMRPLMTDAGWTQLVADLRAFRASLLGASSGPRFASRIRLPDDPAKREEAKRRLQADDPAAILAVYVLSQPPEPLPTPLPAPARDPKADRADLTVPARDGESRLVRLVRTADGWRIDRLQL